jgi:hypothetical protein
MGCWVSRSHAVVQGAEVCEQDFDLQAFKGSISLEIV